MKKHITNGTRNQRVVHLCASMRILCACPHPHANTNCSTSLGSQTYKTIQGFVCSALRTLAMQSCNRTASSTTIKETSERANQPTNQPIPGQCPVHLCASMRTLCACPRTLMPTIFVKQPLMPPTVHQIEYVRTNSTKTQLSKTHKRTYETRDPQPTRCKPMRIYAHTMRIPTSPCQHKLFNKSGLANVQTI
jgi:hypothetical protein